MRARRSYILLHELLTYDLKLYLVEFANTLMQDFIDWTIAHFQQLMCSSLILWKKMENDYLQEFSQKSLKPVTLLE